MTESRWKNQVFPTKVYFLLHKIQNDYNLSSKLERASLFKYNLTFLKVIFVLLQQGLTFRGKEI